MGLRPARAIGAVGRQRAGAVVDLLLRVGDVRHLEPGLKLPATAVAAYYADEGWVDGPAMARALLKRAGAHITVIKTSHLPMISQPKAVENLIETAAAAFLDGGASIVQIRHKSHWSRDAFDSAQRVARLCREQGATLLVKLDRQILEAHTSRPASIGWNRVEGTHQFSGQAPADAAPPIYEYSHSGGGCSVSGGYVYRGAKIPDLRGAYVFSDYCDSAIRALTQRGGKLAGQRELGVKGNQITAFGEGQDGELYVLSQGDGVQRIDPA